MHSVKQSDLDLLRLDLSIKAKNGLNFILAAALTWLLITWIWTLSYGAGTKALFTFYAGGIMLPLAWLFSRVLHTSWNMPDNPLQPLGLWLNFAQLVYFPILVFVYLRHPEYFIMVYVIITGAHFLPYAWFYNTRSYVVMAVLISVGTMWLGLRLPVEKLYLIPLFMSASLVVLGIWLLIDYRIKKGMLA
jgi:hypothetical protein